MRRTAADGPVCVRSPTRTPEEPAEDANVQSDAAVAHSRAADPVSHHPGIDAQEPVVAPDHPAARWTLWTL